MRVLKNMPIIEPTRKIYTCWGQFIIDQQYFEEEVKKWCAALRACSASRTDMAMCKYMGAQMYLMLVLEKIRNLVECGFDIAFLDGEVHRLLIANGIPNV